jgi:hypothetical protein
MTYKGSHIPFSGSGLFSNEKSESSESLVSHSYWLMHKSKSGELVQIRHGRLIRLALKSAHVPHLVHRSKFVQFTRQFLFGSYSIQLAKSWKLGDCHLAKER